MRESWNCFTNLALAEHVALLGLGDVHHLFIAVFIAVAAAVAVFIAVFPHIHSSVLYLRILDGG